MHVPRRTFAVLLLVLLVSLAAPAVRAQEFTTLTLYVNDLASPRALLRSEHLDIEDLCYQVDSYSSVEIAILVVNTTQPYDIDTYAFRTFEANAIGKEGKDNGLLIILSVDERAWRIEVGYGLEYFLTDSVVANFAREYLEPPLADGFYGDGLYDLTLNMGQYIVDNYEEATPTQPSLWVPDWKGIALGVAVAMFLAVITKGRVFFWVGNVFQRGGFGGGRSGGGGARGRL
jgi:uncharacterized protein